MLVPSHSAPRRRPRLEGDSILLGKSTLLARRIVVQGCWEVEVTSDEALSALLSLAYGKSASAMTPMVKTIRSAAGHLIRNPSQASALLTASPEPAEGSDAILAQAADLLQRGVEPRRLEKALRRTHLKLPETPDYCPSLRLTDKGVVLGKGTVIAPLQDHPEGGTGLAVAGRETRILTLLSLAKNDLADETKVMGSLGAASRALTKGDAALAAIALCQMGQPRLEDECLAKRLASASAKLRSGTDPQALLKAHGLPVRRNGRQPDWLRKYDVNQLRHPKGTHEGGRFAPKDASDPASMTPEQKQAEQAKLSDAHDKAMLAAHTYWDPDNPDAGPEPALPSGYRKASGEELEKLGITSNDLSPDDGSSLHAELFVKDGPNDPQYVLAFRGTRPDADQDWLNNGEQGMGFHAEAYDRAKELAKTLAARTDGNLSFTGHSLGGGLASAAAVTTGLPATTFNASGIDMKLIDDKSSTPPKVDAYYVDGEPLSSIQDHRELSIATLRAVPFIGSILGITADVQTLLGHEVLPPAYGERRKLPNSSPSGSSGGSLLDPHSINWVLSGIEARQKQLGGK